MYSKPLASRMDGLHEGITTPPRRAQAGVTPNFASFMQQGATPGSMPGQTATPLEQAGAQGNLGLNQMRAMASLATLNNEAGQVPHVAPETSGQGIPLNPRDMLRLISRTKPDAESAETAFRVKAHRKDKQAQTKDENVVTKALSETLHTWRQKNDDSIQTSSVGKLAAQFESGKDGIASIGYDRHGGTSYGKYQIASRTGTMKNFIGFLETEAPDIAKRLENAGPANTGGKRGKMPETWKQLVDEDPVRFEMLQDKFIRTSHFDPAMRSLAEKTGFNFEDLPSALQEVVFSTSVQHGPRAAERIVARSLNQIGTDKLDPEKNTPEDVALSQENFIRRIYANRSGQFRSSTETVQAAVKNRLRQEMSMAITMLRSEYKEA